MLCATNNEACANASSIRAKLYQTGVGLNVEVPGSSVTSYGCYFSSIEDSKALTQVLENHRETVMSEYYTRSNTVAYLNNLKSKK